MNPRGPGVDDDLVNLGLILIAAVGVIAAILRLAGSVAAWISGAPHTTGGWDAGFRVLSHPGDPASALGSEGLAAWVYWLVLVLMVAALGSVLGTVGGYLLSRNLTRMYAEFYEFPSFSVGLQPQIVVAAVAISFAAAAIGAINAVRRAVALPPAQAMRAAVATTANDAVRAVLAAVYSQVSPVLRLVSAAPIPIVPAFRRMAAFAAVSEAMMPSTETFCSRATTAKASRNASKKERKSSPNASVW